MQMDLNGMKTAGQMVCAMGLALAGLHLDKFRSRDSFIDGESYFRYCLQSYLLDANVLAIFLI